MTDLRCRSCRKKFAEVNVFDGVLQCTRCKHTAHYTVMTQSAEFKLEELVLSLANKSE
jgi:phage FluMu protein Com